MLSNAPRRAAFIARGMEQMGLPAALYPHIMSSGEATWRGLKDRREGWFDGVGDHCFHIGPERDANLFDETSLEPVGSIADADFILNTGPWEDGETVGDYEHHLVAGALSRLKMICANPDLEVIRGGRRIICAGALAQRYEELGHLVVLGLKGWMAPKGWPSGIPPISLVAVLAALVPLLIKRKLIYEKQKRKERTE